MQKQGSIAKLKKKLEKMGIVLETGANDMHK